jgi:hypothetical protein
MDSATLPSRSADAPADADAPLELSYVLRGNERLHGLLVRAPRWLLVVLTILSWMILSNLVMLVSIEPIVGLALPPLVLFVGLPALLGIGVRPTRLRLDAHELLVGPPGREQRLDMRMLVVRVSKLAYVFCAGTSTTFVLPQRVLGEAERRVLDAHIVASGMTRRARAVTSPMRVVGWVLPIVLVLMMFVTIYNLFQSNGRPRRHPRSGKIAPSSFLISPRTSATGRSAFIEPTIWPTGEVTRSSRPVLRA